MKYFKLNNPIKKLRLMLREIDNYYFFMRQVEIMEDTGVLKHNKIKRNEDHAIYGAINMPPELLMYHNEVELDRLEKTFFGNEMTKISDVFLQYDIIELYKIEYERIKTDDYYAYVFNIKYKWQFCNPVSVITYSVGICLAVATAAWLAVLAISQL
jgi:hypothetical protein